MKKLLIMLLISLIFILILAGCQGRKVNRVISAPDKTNSNAMANTSESDILQKNNKNILDNNCIDSSKTTPTSDSSDIESTNNDTALNELDIDNSTASSSIESDTNLETTEKSVIQNEPTDDLEIIQIESSTTPDSNNESIVESDSNSQAINTDENVDNNKTTQSSENIIVAESEDLNNEDEKTAILNEIDALLDSTLNSLDQMDQDRLSDENIVTEGGLE